MGCLCGKYIGLERFPQAERPVQYVTLGMAVGFLRCNLSQFFQSSDQRMISGKHLHAAIRVHRISTTITHMGDRHAVAENEH